MRTIISLQVEVDLLPNGKYVTVFRSGNRTLHAHPHDRLVGSMNNAATRGFGIAMAHLVCEHVDRKPA